LTIAELVYGYFLGRGQRALAVSSGDQLQGIVTMTDVKELDQERWPMTRVREIMTSSPLYTASPNDEVSHALRTLAENNVNQLLVTDDGRLVGVLSRSDLIRHIQFRQELRIEDTSKAHPGTGVR
jgi:CBS domain-containing protein